MKRLNDEKRNDKELFDADFSICSHATGLIMGDPVPGVTAGSVIGAVIPVVAIPFRTFITKVWGTGLKTSRN